ncbi:MAG: triose-phosphate isomerase [Methanomicrobia archaeon]|nr:triose-phosphate isomerase [Methanomicrobia archaeon]
MRKKLLLGNWKMNKTREETKVFALGSLALSALADLHGIDIGVAPTYLSLPVVKKYNPGLIVAAQNVHYQPAGAYTGEISISMLKEINITWAIIGHSERRSYDNETSEKCNLKIKALLQNEMIPVYCVGETLAQFEQKATKDVIKQQIIDGFKDISSEQAQKVVVAYEPVWSIGTGKNASAEIAQDVCSFIRNLLREQYKEGAEEIRILYGGSVKPENVKTYLSTPDIDGALVGGASLSIESFKDLINNMI